MLNGPIFGDLLAYSSFSFLNSSVFLPTFHPTNSGLKVVILVQATYSPWKFSDTFSLRIFLGGNPVPPHLLLDKSQQGWERSGLNERISVGKCGKSLSLKSIFSGKWATGNENDRDHLEALCPCFLSRLFSSVESSWTKSKGGGQVTWLGALIMSVKTQFPFACPFCIFSLQRPFTETLSLPAFKGTCHRGSQPGRRKVGKI